MPPAGSFASTHWSVVLQVQLRESPAAHDALAALCSVYWYPLYAYIRRQVESTDKAEDLTQVFFTRLLEKNYLDQVDRSHGKFRAFLLACCKHFLANERDRERAQKRGGGCSILPLDFQNAAERYHREQRWGEVLVECLEGPCH
jgi:DNA-directed RNA polymerase specialized sigma24 family protein